MRLLTWPARLLTRRRVAGLAVVVVVFAAMVLGFGLRDQLPIAVALLALAGGLGLLALLQLVRQTRQQVAQLHRGSQQLARDLRSWPRLVEGAQRGQRRVWEAVEQERRAAEARQQALLTMVESRQKATARSLKRLGDQLTKQQRDQTREVEALLQLFGGFRGPVGAGGPGRSGGFVPRAPMPSSGHWALNPTDLLELWLVVDRRRPALVLELGSGVSSVWLGYAVERYGGQLISIDHDPAYATQTRAQLRRHGLDQLAEVRLAPLRPVTLDGELFQWYDQAAFTGVAGVELLLVDGPPGGTGPQARYPALRLLSDQLAPQATVVLDDAERPDEQKILRRWVEAAPGLVHEPGTLGHLAVLTFSRPV